MRKLLLFFSASIFVIVYVTGNLTPWENLSVCLFVYFFLTFLMNLGNRIAILDLTIIMACLTCLIMPVVFYHVYTRENTLARIWAKYMPISSSDYFSFAVPAVIALALGLKIPLRKFKLNADPGAYLENIKEYLKDRPKLGLILIAVGLLSGFLDFLVPGSLKEFFFLMAHLIFVGVFYVIYSPNKNKRVIVPAVILLMIGESILTGMFGELIFILACALVLLMLGAKIKYRKKLLFAFLGIFIIVLLQSIKGDYRQKSWREGGGADPFYFGELIVDRITNPSSMLDPKGLFVLSVRMNQGWMVANTMKMVPQRHSFGNGEPLLISVAASVVPRFVWPEKPEAGGKANLKRFWGFDLIGWSTNIGTLGEAYANFDRTGGLVYMFFYGLFFNIILSIIIKLSERRPTIILWLPYLFFAAITVETDLLSTMGALVKGVIFAWIVFVLFDRVFRLKL
ncbi:MAG TPA: hypothetical protein VGN00_23395 [Puia sp.]|jgi:hypothetical protein